MNNNELQIENLKNFILKVAGKQLNKTITNAVVEGIITKVNENNSTYEVQPKNSNAAAAITATSLNDTIYQVNDLVYMISYEGDLSTVYHIFGSVKSVAEDFINLSLEDRFEADDFLPITETELNTEITDEKYINQIKQAGCFKIEGRFKALGNGTGEPDYGLKIELFPDENNRGVYYLNPPYFLGQPYNLDGSIVQSRIVTLTQDEVNKIQYIKISTHSEDGFSFEYSDIKLSFGTLLNIEGTLNVLTTIENDKDYVSSRNLNDKAVVSVKVNYDGQELNSTLLSYYWLLKDENVKAEGDNGYFAAAGAGWRCLNSFEEVSILGIDTKLRFWRDESRTFELFPNGITVEGYVQLPHYENTLKCLVQFKDLTAESREFTIYNYDKEQFSATLVSNVEPASIISKTDSITLTCDLKNENKKWNESDSSYEYIYTWYKEDDDSEDGWVNITPKEIDGAYINTNVLTIYGAESDKKVETSYIVTDNAENIYCKVTINKNGAIVSAEETNKKTVTSYIGLESTIKKETFYKYYISTNMNVIFKQEASSGEGEGSETEWSGDWIIEDSSIGESENPSWENKKDDGTELKENDGYNIVFKDTSIVYINQTHELEIPDYIQSGPGGSRYFSITINTGINNLVQIISASVEEYDNFYCNNLQINSSYITGAGQVTIFCQADIDNSIPEEERNLKFIVELCLDSFNINDDLYVYYTQKDVWTQEKMGESKLIKEENWATPLIARGLDYDASNGGWYNSKEGAAAEKINTFNKLTNNGTLEGIQFDGDEAYINATYINTGVLRVGDENEEVFLATIEKNSEGKNPVKIAGFYVDKNSIYSNNGSINISSDDSDATNLAIAIGKELINKFTISSISEIHFFYKIYTDNSIARHIYSNEELASDIDGNTITFKYDAATNLPILSLTLNADGNEDLYIYGGQYSYNEEVYDKWNGTKGQQGTFLLTNLIVAKEVKEDSEKFSVNHGGQLKAKDGDIGGWQIDENKIFKNTAVLSSSDDIVQESLINSSASPVRLSIGASTTVTVSKDFNIYYTAEQVYNGGGTLYSIVDVGDTNISGVQVVVSDTLTNNISDLRIKEIHNNLVTIEIVYPQVFYGELNISLTIRYGILSGPLTILEDGSLYAKAAKIEGEIRAGAGEIGGWQINEDSLSTNNVKLITSNSVVGDSLVNSGTVSPVRFSIGPSEEVKEPVTIQCTGAELKAERGSLSLTYQLKKSNFIKNTVQMSIDDNISQSNLSQSSIINIRDDGLIEYCIGVYAKDQAETKWDDLYLQITFSYITSPNTMILEDGSLYAKATSLSGNIAATSGTIGGFNITRNKLFTQNVDINSITGTEEEVVLNVRDSNQKSVFSITSKGNIYLGGPKGEEEWSFQKLALKNIAINDNFTELRFYDYNGYALYSPNKSPSVNNPTMAFVPLGIYLEYRNADGAWSQSVTPWWCLTGLV